MYFMSVVGCVSIMHTILRPFAPFPAPLGEVEFSTILQVAKGGVLCASVRVQCHVACVLVGVYW